MNIIGRRRLWYVISLSLLIPGVILLLAFRLRLGIDFTGGTVVEVRGNISSEQLRSLAESKGMQNITVSSSAAGQALRFRPVEGEAGNQLQDELNRQITDSGGQIARFDQVGPSVSRDIAKNALISIGLVAVAIVLYIAYSFRSVPKPVSSWSFGVMAVIALLHDGLLVLGAFAILGRFLAVEIDTYFVTAILTVLGFSVHDTIVVFDRIRENLIKRAGKLGEVVNVSINEVLVRSLSTSIVVILVLFALFLFGGASTRHFVLALLIGIVSGVYSSIFIASPLLVSWQEFKEKRQNRPKSKGKKRFNIFRRSKPKRKPLQAKKS